MEGVDQAYINRCQYHPTNDPLCPIFRLRDIIEFSGFNYSDIARLVCFLFVIICIHTPHPDTHTFYFYAHTYAHAALYYLNIPQTWARHLDYLKI